MAYIGGGPLLREEKPEVQNDAAARPMAVLAPPMRARPQQAFKLSRIQKAICAEWPLETV